MSTATGNKVFAPAIFFIAAREALEASLVIGILSGMLENLVVHTKSAEDLDSEHLLTEEEKQAIHNKKRALVRKLRRIVSCPPSHRLSPAHAFWNTDAVLCVLRCRSSSER